MDILAAMRDAPVSDAHRVICARQIEKLVAWEEEPVSKVEWSEDNGIIYFMAKVGKGTACIGAPKAA